MVTNAQALPFAALQAWTVSFTVLELFSGAGVYTKACQMLGEAFTAQTFNEAVMLCFDQRFPHRRLASLISPCFRTGA